MHYFKTPRPGIWLLAAVFALAVVARVKSGFEQADVRLKPRARNILHSKVYGFVQRPPGQHPRGNGPILVRSNSIYKTRSSVPEPAFSRQELTGPSIRRLQPRSPVANASPIAIRPVPHLINITETLAGAEVAPAGRMGGLDKNRAMEVFSPVPVPAGRVVAGTGEPEANSAADSARTNPFLVAIRDILGSDAAAAVTAQVPSASGTNQDQQPPSKPEPQPSPPRPPVEEVSTGRTVPAPPSPNREVAQSLPQGTESSAPTYSGAFIIVGDFGDHRLQMVRATKSSRFSFLLEGDLGLVPFESGLDFGPLQSFWLGGSSVHPAGDLVVSDRNFNLIDWYSGTGPGTFLFQSGFYFSAGILGGAAASDINGDGLPDLVVGSQPTSAEFADQGIVYLYHSRNGAYVYQRGIFVGFPVGAIHVTRSGGRTRILAVDRTLSRGQVLSVDSTGLVLGDPVNVLPLQQQETKLTFSDGKDVWVRLAEFAEVTFLASFSREGFHPIASIEKAGRLPYLAIGELNQDGQRRCWVHF
ncbi:MAG: FG-GAP repeat protein [Acidobacteria bacterium]|nr:FG-GAP repeat protein [Acidobacteriota bacterium]